MLNRDELLKEKLIDKKDDIKNVFANRLTYEKWDKKSPVYVYNIFNSEFEKIDDISRISFLLRAPYGQYTLFFSNENDVKIYKWLMNTVEDEINNRIIDGLDK